MSRKGGGEEGGISVPDGGLAKSAQRTIERRKVI